jgi:hypothetical protein
VATKTRAKVDHLSAVPAHLPPVAKRGQKVTPTHDAHLEVVEIKREQQERKYFGKPSLHPDRF